MKLTLFLYLGIYFKDHLFKAFEGSEYDPTIGVILLQMNKRIKTNILRLDVKMKRIKINHLKEVFENAQER